MTLKQTPLYKSCLDCGCRMSPFAGWEMPIQFSGLINEHESVRHKAGVFDISHMGVICIKGENAKDQLQRLVPSDLYRINKGEACYTVFLNPMGGIIDDLIIYDLGLNNEEAECLVLVINAGCTTKDLAWLNQNLDLSKISITDHKKDGVLLALQGPEAQKILEKVLQTPLSSIPRFGHKYLEILNNQFNTNDPKSLFIARTGYTGEEGFELLLSGNSGELLWSVLIKEGAIPCGLGARDTLRLEAAMHLYGHEMNSETSPFEAGLGWLVHLEMPKDFIGRKVLENQASTGVSRRLIGLKIDGRGIARQGYPVISNNKEIGKITSGSWSPTLKTGIAMAYIPTELTKIGTKVNVSIRGKEVSAEIVKRPFYRRNQNKN